MNKRIATIMLVLVASTVGAAVLAESGDRSKGDRGGRHGMHGDNVAAPGHFSEKMADRLELDETQRQTLQNIQLAAEPEITALRERMQANREAMKVLDPNDPNRSALLNDIAIEKGQLTTEPTAGGVALPPFQHILSSGLLITKMFQFVKNIQDFQQTERNLR